MFEDSPLIRERRAKLEKIKQMGIKPYPGRFERTHNSINAKAVAEKGKCDVEAARKKKADVKIAGRIMTLREHGHLIFAQLQDQEGRIQICWMKEFTPADQFEFVKLLDLGDFVGLTGVLFMTHKGEPTLLIKDCQLLSKSLRPLPEKWHGLHDQEVKYRKRHLDLIMNREEVMKRFKKRREIIDAMRKYLLSHGYMEVETPILHSLYGGAMARPFETYFNALEQTMYLRISNELFLKRLIVGGYDRVFEFSIDFRNEGIDTSHNPEFLLMETMMAYGCAADNMKENEEMFAYIAEKTLGTTKIQYQGQKIDLTPPWKRVSVVDAVKEITKGDFNSWKSDEDARKAARKHGLKKVGPKTSKFGVLMAFFDELCEEKFIQPTFIYNYPREVSPLAKIDLENPDFTERFELVIAGKEYANSYSELNDPVELRENFQEQQKHRAELEGEAHPIDEEFIEAIEHGMPPTSGLGIGVDRLVMLLTDTTSIREVIFFPALRSTIAQPVKETLQTKQTTTLVNDDQKNINIGLSYAAALKLFDAHVKNPMIRNHSIESAAVMRALAKRFGANEEAWGILGLLHDIDWDPETSDPKNHGIHSEKILREAGMTDTGIAVIKSHVFGLKGHNHPFENEVRTRFIEFALAAGETVTGLIHSAALVRPDKKIASAEVSSIKKKFKDKAFAGGVDRNVVKECEKLGLTMDEFLGLALDAIKGVAKEVGI
ncbi:MAG: lysine--tRNA ligase [Candidatus Peregrinibacteria bacterium]